MKLAPLAPIRAELRDGGRKLKAEKEKLGVLAAQFKRLRYDEMTRLVEGIVELGDVEL